MEKIAIFIPNKSFNEKTLSTIQYYLLNNKNYVFDLFIKANNLITIPKDISKFVSLIEISNFELEKLIISKKYRLILTFGDTENIIETLKTNSLTYFSGHFLESGSKKSILIKVKETDIIDPSFFNEEIVNSINNSSIKIAYAENKNFINEKIITSLKKLKSFEGVIDLSKIFECDYNIVFISEHTSSILIDCFKAFNEQKNKKIDKSVGTYFGRMFTNFSKVKEVSLNDSFYDIDVYFGLDTEIISLSSNVDSTMIIHLLKSLNNFLKL